MGARQRHHFVDLLPMLAAVRGKDSAEREIDADRACPQAGGLLEHALLEAVGRVEIEHRVRRQWRVGPPRWRSKRDGSGGAEADQRAQRQGPARARLARDDKPSAPGAKHFRGCDRRLDQVAIAAASPSIRPLA
jgi:hypothetical protein